MTEKLNNYKYYILSLALIIVLTIASFYYLNSPKTKIETDNVQFNFSIDGKNYIMPSAFHSFHYLNNINFQWKELAENNTNSNFNNDSQTSLMLGIKAANGVVFLFANERENAKKAKATVIELTEKLDINSDIKEALSALDNAVIKNSDRSILEDKIIQLQYQIEKALRKKNKDNLAALVELGGWLEGLRIISKGIMNHYNPDQSEILKQFHVAQIYIEVLSALAKRTSSDKEKLLLESILTNLIQISKITNHPHSEAFPLEKVKELYKISSDVKKIIESNDDNPNK